MTHNDEAQTPEPKIIKRYPNRKLYDTSRSIYVKLEDIEALLQSGEDVKVVDARSGEDLTAITLTQVLHDGQKREQRMPLSLLRKLVQSGSERVSGKVTETVSEISSGLSHSLTGLIPEKLRDAWMNAQSYGDLIQEIESLKARVERLEKQLNAPPKAKKSAATKSKA